tara:strand:+ start:1563 stop:1742 length:180 start_codon:yes stop_codon:yes gene_type:complete
MSDQIPEYLQQDALDVKDVVEDAVEYICRENQLSGEMVWSMINGLSEAHLNQFPNPNDN